MAALLGAELRSWRTVSAVWEGFLRPRWIWEGGDGEAVEGVVVVDVAAGREERRGVVWREVRGEVGGVKGCWIWSVWMRVSRHGQLLRVEGRGKEHTGPLIDPRILDVEVRSHRVDVL